MFHTPQPTLKHNSLHSQSQTSLLQRNPQGPQVTYSDRKLEHINCILPQTEESGALFIGDTISTLRTQYLTDNNIKAVLCCNSEASKNVHMTRISFDYKYMEIKDHGQYPIKLHFDSATDFIDSKIKGKKNTLVQCHGGASRSVTLVLAYLIKVKGWSLEGALKYVKQKRHRAKPNMGFYKQLEQYQALLNKNKTQQNQKFYNTPLRHNKKQKMSISPTDTYDKDERTQSKRKETSLEPKIKTNEKLETGKSFKSQEIIINKFEETEKQLQPEKIRKKILGEDYKKKSQVRQSEIIKNQAPYQYYKQQQQLQNLNKTTQVPKITTQPNFYHTAKQSSFIPQTIQQPTYQPSMFQIYTPFQPQQMYYKPPPPTNYVNFPNRTQPVWFSKAY